MKKILQYIIPLGLAGFLLWYSYKDMDAGEMTKGLHAVHYWAMWVTFLCTLVAHWARAARWNMFFKPVGYDLGLKNSFLAVMSGYFANLILPRAGELTRCTVLVKSDNIPLQTSIGTVLAERALDLVMLGLVTLAALGLEYETLTGFFGQIMEQKGPESESSGVNIKLIFVFALLVIGVLAYFFRHQLLKIPIINKVLNFVMGLLEGILSITRLENPILFIVYTVLIWSGYYFTTYFSLYMFDFTDNLGFNAAFMLLVIGSFGMVAPVQGGIGAFHFLVSAALMQLYQKEEAMSKLAAAMMHGSQTLFTLVLGGVCFIFAVVIPGRKERKALQQQDV